MNSTCSELHIPHAYIVRYLYRYLPRLYHFYTLRIVYPLISSEKTLGPYGPFFNDTADLTM